LDRRLGGPRADLDDVEKRKFLILPGLELDLSVVQPLGSRYADCVIPAHKHRDNFINFLLKVLE
jgi:hypothetical protein